MSKNTFKAFVDTLTLLLNTPMVPPEENSQEMEVALTELPVSSRNSRQYASSSNFDKSTSSEASSADSLRTSFDIVPHYSEFEEVQLSHPSSFSAVKKPFARTSSARAIPVPAPRLARIYSVDDTYLNDTFGLGESEKIDGPRSLGEITFAPVYDEQDPLF